LFAAIVEEEMASQRGRQQTIRWLHLRESSSRR